MARTSCCRAYTGCPATPYAPSAPSISGLPCPDPSCPLREILAQMPEEVRAVHLRACEAAKEAGHGVDVVRSHRYAPHSTNPRDHAPHWLVGTNFEDGIPSMCWYDKPHPTHGAPGWYFRSPWEGQDSPLDGTPLDNAAVMFG